MPLTDRSHMWRELLKKTEHGRCGGRCVLLGGRFD
jgi:hypothetical protein